MKTHTKDRILDKGVDILVVIVGILIALSIDSYKDSNRSQNQWRMFADQFKADATLYAKNYSQIIAFYSERVKSTKAMIQKVNEGHKQIQQLGQFIPSMGELRVDFPSPILYEALIQSGNQNLINDTKKLRIIGKFYSFEILAMTKAQIFTEHFSPEYKKLLKKYFKSPTNMDPIREDLLYTLYMYLRIMEDNLKTYKSQEENRLQLLHLLNY